MTLNELFKNTTYDDTLCTVRWNESLSETAIKNASITRVVESQEKELAAAI